MSGRRKRAAPGKGRWAFGNRHLFAQLLRLVDDERSTSAALRRERLGACRTLCDQLYGLGYRGLEARGLGTRHVDALVAEWKRRVAEDELQWGRVKNLMVHVRWWARAVGKDGMVHPHNAAYGIGRRSRTPGDRSVELADALSRIGDPYVAYALRLQDAFGLRRQEAIKFRVAYADRGARILLKASWCKGGRARWVPVRSYEQRALLQELRDFAGERSLIPPGLEYVQQKWRFEKATARAGLGRTHGLRHGYGQRRFEKLAGFPCPAKGGPGWRDLTPEQRERDETARRIVSMELGHGRVDVTSVYLSK